MIFFYKSLKSFRRIVCNSFSLNALNELPLPNNVRLCTTEARALQKFSVRSMRRRTSKLFQFGSWILVIIPVSAFGLGTWQVFRKLEKEELNKKFLEMIKQPAVDFPQNLEDLKNMEYRAVRVKGRFDHSKELYMGPRPHVTEDVFTKPVSLLSVSNAGYLVVTPFTLSDRNLTIMVNRGWVPANKKLPKTREEGQISEEVELVGLVRLAESREPLGVKNLPESGYWLYRDLKRMSEYNGASPIFLDAVRANNVPGGPDGGQTVIKLRNDHTTYIYTWYGLAAVTGYMWYLRHFRRPGIIV